MEGEPDLDVSVDFCQGTVKGSGKLWLGVGIEVSGVFIGAAYRPEGNIFTLHFSPFLPCGGDCQGCCQEEKAGLDLFGEVDNVIRPLKSYRVRLLHPDGR